jgi:hypothetical protein
MAGMEGLGRVCDVIPIAAGQAFKFRHCSGALFVCTGADTFTVTVSATYGGSYTSPGNYITRYYQRASEDATTAWTLQTQAASNAVVQAGAYTTAIHLFTSQIPAPYAYAKCSAAGSGLVVAVLYDLTVQRGPEMLEILGS